MTLDADCPIFIVKLSVLMLNGIMVDVVLLSVVTPENKFRSQVCHGDVDKMLTVI
jgi:hypothetical protein